MIRSLFVLTVLISVPALTACPSDAGDSATKTSKAKPPKKDDAKAPVKGTDWPFEGKPEPKNPDALAELQKEALNTPNRTVFLPTPESLMLAIDFFNEKSGGKAELHQFVEISKSLPKEEKALGVATGSLVTSFFILLKAEDAKRCKEVTKLLISAAEKLDAPAKVQNSGKSLAKAVSAGDWKAATVAVNEVYDELVVKFNKQGDGKAAMTYVALGSWIEGVYLTAKLLDSNYSESTAEILRQERMAQYFYNLIKETKGSDDRKTKIQAELQTLKNVMSANAESALGKAEIKKVLAASEKIRAAS